jgi:hypothetical protein
MALGAVALQSIVRELFIRFGYRGLDLLPAIELRF